MEAYISFVEADSAFYVRYMLQFSLWDPALGRLQGLDKLAHPQQRKLSKSIIFPSTVFSCFQLVSMYTAPCVFISTFFSYVTVTLNYRSRHWLKLALSFICFLHSLYNFTLVKWTHFIGFFHSESKLFSPKNEGLRRYYMSKWPSRVVRMGQ